MMVAGRTALFLLIWLSLASLSAARAQTPALAPAKAALEMLRARVVATAAGVERQLGDARRAQQLLKKDGAADEDAIAAASTTITRLEGLKVRLAAAQEQLAAKVAALGPEETLAAEELRRVTVEGELLIAEATPTGLPTTTPPKMRLAFEKLEAIEEPLFQDLVHLREAIGQVQAARAEAEKLRAIHVERLSPTAENFRKATSAVAYLDKLLADSSGKPAVIGGKIYGKADLEKLRADAAAKCDELKAAYATGSENVRKLEERTAALAEKAKEYQTRLASLQQSLLDYFAAKRQLVERMQQPPQPSQQEVVQAIEKLLDILDRKPGLLEPPR